MLLGREKVWVELLHQGGVEDSGGGRARHIEHNYVNAVPQSTILGQLRHRAGAKNCRSGSRGVLEGKGDISYLYAP